MKTISIFGASKLGEEAYYFLNEVCEIDCFIDNDPNKWGTTFLGKKIYSPEYLKSKQDSSIIIASFYYKEIHIQLVEMGILDFYIFKSNEFIIVKDNEYKENLEESAFQKIIDNHFSKTIIEKMPEKRISKNTVYKKDKKRTFTISNYNYNPGVGGPVTVMYKLFQINDSYDLMDNFFMLTPSLLLEPNYYKDEQQINKFNSPSDFFSTFSNAMEGRTLFYAINLIKIKNFIIQLHHRYNFSEKDVFLFHDVNTAFVFSEIFPQFKNVIQVYHGQGSMYYEHKAYTGENSEQLKAILNYLHTETLTRNQHFGFPSKGSYEELIKTEPSYKELFKGKKVHFLYNGYDKSEIFPSDKIIKVADFIKNFTYKFISVATLNHAKGVERIPRVLKNIVGDSKEFLWIVVGDGIQSEKLEENIKKYELENNVLWIREKIPHDDILYLFSVTDFYIMLHRNSIFDLATLEAMAYGNIPLLSYVGGNKEFIIDGNGKFIDEDTNLFKISELNDFLSEMSNKNQYIVEHHFSEYKFLERYHKLIDIL